MIRILISDPLSEEGIKILKEAKEFQVDVNTGLKPEELKEIIKDYDAIIVRSATKLTKDIIDAATNLKVIGRAGVGLDNVDLEAATKRGIIAMNTPAGNTISTAEHAMSLILALSRNIAEASQSTKAGEWKRSKFMGVELYGKTLGIIGLGRIGTEVAKRSLSFGMNVIAYDPFLSIDVAKKIGVEIVDLKKLLSSADYITIQTHISDETKGMISDKEFDLMKKTARIINCARGGIIDEAALARALGANKIAGCALDVFEKEPPVDSPLLKCATCLMTPHLGASTEEAQVNVAIEIAEVVRDALLGKAIRNAANFPSVAPEVYRSLEPFISLGEKLGQLASQMVEGRLKQADITYSGQVAGLETKPVTLAVIKGVLSPILQETVNFVNATNLAEERGIKIQEAKSSQEEEFVNLISVELVTDKEKINVSGTLFSNKEPRIVKIDNFYMEAIPKGYMVIAHNLDKPGIIGALGTILGKNAINIAGMTFGREAPGAKAITVINVDSPVSAEIIEQIKKSPNILSARLIKL